MRKYLTSGVVEPKYPARSVANKLDAFASKLEGWLKSEAKKGRKQRRNTRQLFNDLVVLGFEGEGPAEPMAVEDQRPGPRPGRPSRWSCRRTRGSPIPR